MTADAVSSAHSRTLTRRSFLAGGTAIAASAWLLGPNSRWQRPNGLVRLAAGSAQPLSVGYVDGSAGATQAELHDLLATGRARVVPAGSLRSGDRSLAGRIARVRIHGPAPGSWTDADPTLSAVELDALVNSPDRRAAEAVLPYFAWTEVVRPVATSSSPTSMLVAVGDEASLGFAIRVRRLTDTLRHGTNEGVAVLSGGREYGMAKIRRGAYLIAPDASAWAKPRVLSGDMSDVQSSFLVSVDRHQTTT